MISNTTRLLVRNVFYLGIGQIASTALGILMTAVLGRGLEPAQFGILYTVFAIAGFAFVLLDWGHATYLVREMARGRADEPQLIGSAILFRIGTTALSTVAVVIVAIAAGYDGEIIRLVLLALMVGIPASLFVPFSCSIRSKDRMDFDAMATNLGKAFALTATVIALRVGGLPEVILAQGVGGIATLLIGFAAAKRLGITVRLPDKAVLRELFRRGAPIAAFSLVLATQPIVEVLLISTLTNAAVVGWYGASRTIFNFVISPATIVFAATFPHLSRVSRSLPEFRQMIQSTARVLCIMAALTSSGLYLFADHIVTIIYGHGRFEQTAEILRVNAVFVPLLSFVLLLAAAMTAVGQNKAMVVISIARIAICVVLSWLLVGDWQQRFGNGAIALVIIAGIAEIPAMIACLVLLPRGSVGSATLVNLARACIASLLVVAPLSMLQPLGLLYLTPLFVVVFAAVAFATRLVVAKDLEFAREFARGRGFGVQPKQSDLDTKN